MALSCDAGFQYSIYFLTMVYRFIIALVFISVFYSCNKIKYYPDKDYEEVTTLILAHRAGGGGYSPYQDYSVEAADTSFSIVDGVEVDLQISKDEDDMVITWC